MLQSLAFCDIICNSPIWEDDAMGFFLWGDILIAYI